MDTEAIPPQTTHLAGEAVAGNCHPVFSLFCPQAMDLEVPVLARNIPGNAAVVKHEVTGLLFSDPQVREVVPGHASERFSFCGLHCFSSSQRPLPHGGSPACSVCPQGSRVNPNRDPDASPAPASDSASSGQRGLDGGRSPLRRLAVRFQSGALQTEPSASRTPAGFLSGSYPITCNASRQCTE